MILDANTFQLELTPEAALGIVQKEIQKRGWKKWDVTEIRLVYTPYWLFSFDVMAEQAVPTGKAALNAATGELDEIATMIVERPLKKTKMTDDKAKSEVESTVVSRMEAEKIAAVKVASSAGIKKDNVATSAFNKVYLPFYRVWLNVDGVGDFKVNVDALLGIPSGTEQVPSKGKNWDDATAEALDKMKTPSGIASLAGEALSGAGGPEGLVKDKRILWAAMGIIILAILFFASPLAQGGGLETTCVVADRYLGEKQYFNLLGEQYLKPSKTLAGQLQVAGTCFFKAKGSSDTPGCVKTTLYQDGQRTAYSNTTCAIARGGSSVPAEKEFTVTWNGTANRQYTLAAG